MVNTEKKTGKNRGLCTDVEKFPDSLPDDAEKHAENSINDKNVDNSSLQSPHPGGLSTVRLTKQGGYGYSLFSCVCSIIEPSFL
jgi:hypothetical protein